MISVYKGDYGECALLVTHSGELYAVGNSSKGCLGLEDVTETKEPLQLQGITGVAGYVKIDDFEMEDYDEDGGEEESEESEIDSTTTTVSNLNSNKQIKAEKRKGEVPQPQQNKKGKNLAEEAAGGTGIYRPVNNKASVTDNRSVGSVYKSKKGSGDVKRSGMPSPYAYMPLQRSKLNRRKKMKASIEFKSIVRGAKKGTKIGSKLKQKGKRQ